MLTKVNVNIIPEFTLTGNEGLYTSLIVGKSSFGPENTIVEINNFKTAKELFKEGDLVDGVKYYFYGGGANLKVLRVVPNDSTKAEKVFNNSSVGDESGIKIEAKYKGSYGNNIFVNISSENNKKVIKISDGNINEKFEFTTNDELVETINSQSNLVTVTKLTDDLPDDTTGDVYLEGGSDGTFNDDIYFEVIRNVAYTADYDILVVVGNTSDTLYSQLSNMVNSRANENKYSVVIGGVAKNESINDAISRNSTGGRLVIVYGWDENKDGSFIAAAYAGLLSVLDTTFSPIKKNIGIKTITKYDIYGNVTNLTFSEKQKLDKAGFTIIENGVVVNDRTRLPESEWNSEIEAVRKVDNIIKKMVEIVNGYVGKPNDSITRNSIKQDLNAFLNRKADERLIEKQFLVNVEKGTDPREIIINAKIKLVYSIKTVTINLHLSI